MIRRVKVANGFVRGLPAADPRITSYKGIPYAAPPVGVNRWRAPQPCPDWEGDFCAYQFSPIPMQAPISADPKNLYDREWHVDKEIPMGEDCLTLNVWAPADGREGMPVFVWFFGGGLQVGYSAEMEFDGERLARRGIVVVTINYRVGVFGFLSHPELTREAPGAPTNFGFLDQQAALRWVKANIAAFGGDPDKVTIGGQSAGGMSVCAQMTCPKNEGLFRAAIIQSGAFAPPYPSVFGLTHSLEEAQDTGRRFFEFIGVKSLEEARAMDAVTLRNKALEWEARTGWARSFGEVVDGVFSLRNSQEWFRDPARLRCPVMFGSTDSEFMTYPPAETPEELRAFARKAYGAGADSFLAAFAGADTAEAIRERGKVSSIGYCCRLAAALNAADERPVPLYQYLFAADIPGSDHAGTFHSVDLWFFFETLSKCWRPFTGKHYDLARQMCDYWANFIRTGDPNGEDSQGKALPAWPPLDGRSNIRMTFGDTAYPEDNTPGPVEAFLLRNALGRAED